MSAGFSATSALVAIGIGEETAADIVAVGSAVGEIASIGGVGEEAYSLASAAGPAVQGYSQAQTAQYQSEIAQQNQQLALLNAQEAQAQGQSDIQQKQQQTSAQIGGIKAAEAGSGIDVNSGSSLDVQSSAAALGELSALNIGYNAQTKANSYIGQANVDTAQSQLYQSQIPLDIAGGLLNPNSSLIGTVGSTANNLFGSSSNNASIYGGASDTGAGTGGLY